MFVYVPVITHYFSSKNFALRQRCNFKVWTWLHAWQDFCWGWALK